MDVQIAKSWKDRLQPEFEKEYFQQLVGFVKKEYTQHKVFPPGNEIFRVTIPQFTMIVPFKLN